MRLRAHLLSVLIVLALAVGAQIAYTDVGREVGGDWSRPTELSSLSGGSTAAYPDVAAAGDGDRAVVAWIETTAGEYRLRAALLARGPDGFRVVDRRTIRRTADELRAVDAALVDGRLAVAVENAGADRITLFRGPASGGDLTAVTVSSGEAARVESVDVAAVGDRTAVAWRAYADDGFAGRLALVGSAGDAGDATDGATPVAVLDRRALPNASTGRNSPALAAAGPDALAVAWASGADAGVHLAVGPPMGDRSGERVGDARSGASSFGSANRPPVVDIAASPAVGADATVLAWTDLSVVHVAAGDAATAEFGPGSRLRIAGDATDWTAIWTVADRTSGRDLVFARGTAAAGDDAGSGGGSDSGGSDAPSGARAEAAATVHRGHVSRLPSNTLAAAPAYLGGEPAVAWVERGGDLRLLVSGYTGDGPVGPVGRVAATPLRFAFVSLVAVALAVVTVPLLPWVAGPLLAGFLLTTRTALSTVGAVAARIAGQFGRSMRPADVRSRVQSAPAWVALAAFVPVNLAAFAYLGRNGVVPGVPAIEPFGLTAMALVATASVAVARGIDSPWRLVFAYGYCQSVALWAAAAPAFL